MRVVSVLPSATEIVYALGHGRDLVGRSAECDYPPEAAALPVVMRSRSLDQDRPSREIDARVRSARSAGKSLYELDVGLLRSLRPDLLLTQDLCGVCSVTDREVEEACAAAGVRPRIVSLAPRRLEEVWRSVETVGDVLGDPIAGRELAEKLRKRSSRSVPRGAARVAVVEWLDPPILAGLWTPDIVRQAGGLPLGPEEGTVAARTTWPGIAEMRPDLVVLSPCSFTVERTRRELRDPRIAEAVRPLAPARGTFLADEAYFSRPGPRLADGVDLVSDLLRGALHHPPMPVEGWTTAPEEASA
ncbi:MAG: cobalamin-binding protein [Thermoplasmata archaeon]